MTTWQGFELEEDGRITRPGDDSFNENHVIEALPTSDGLAVWICSYGPRGGRRYLASGSLGQLRYLRVMVSEAIEFGEQVEVARQAWLKDRTRDV